ncbi:MAG: DNA polymerase IV [Ruminococcaceae bacterium]|nr:DNA polymerase IV [Oscillospiraceae bacterium]
MERTIFHIDANSAFLSWTAVYRLKVLGEKVDLRQIPSVIAGDRESRQGVVLAKSQPAKKYGIQTGEPIFKALQKCPNLVMAPPDYALYVEVSRHFTALLRQFSPMVEQYSIDEAWVDMTGTEGLYGTPTAAAELMRRRINEELGFTVNIGISSNKLLAKMAGDFEKPNKIHTLYPYEIERKLWCLPVRDLFMVGSATERKLHLLGIHTIGELAAADPEMIQKKLHKPGVSLWHCANGRYCDMVVNQPPENKGYGNATTLPSDVLDSLSAYKVLLSLCETVASRMRADLKAACCLSVSLRSNEFRDFSHQMMLPTATDGTDELFRYACHIFDEAWDGQTPLRQLGVHATRLQDSGMRQYDLFLANGTQDYERKARLDNAVDDLREKYGEGILRRARFLGEKIVLAGGLAKERRTGITKPI